MKLGRVDIEAGNILVKRFGVWVPDGLHIWLGTRGVHLYWHRSKYQGRVIFDNVNTALNRLGSEAEADDV